MVSLGIDESKPACRRRTRCVLVDALKQVEPDPTRFHVRNRPSGVYADAVQHLSKQIEAIAEEQWSADPTVIVENYLDEEEAHRR